MTFKLLPDVSSASSPLASSSWGLYLGKSAVASAYGAAGSLVIIVVWVYYSAEILLFGAEFTKVWTKQRGSGFVPDKTARPVTEEARSRAGPGAAPMRSGVGQGQRCRD